MINMMIAMTQMEFIKQYDENKSFFLRSFVIYYHF